MQSNPDWYKCSLILQPNELYSNSHSLYLGNKGSLREEISKERSIGAVLTVMDSYMYGKLQIAERVAQLGIPPQRYLWVELEDDEEVDISKEFQKCHEFIDRNIRDVNVLVHCQAGVSRSATIVISYIMKVKKIPLNQANKFVVSRRHQVSPNQGFFKALQNYELTLTSIPDPETPFTQEKYLTKFCQHIVSFRNPSNYDNSNIFLGQATAVKANYLSNLNIKAIISILTPEQSQTLKIKPLCEHLNITHKHIEISDSSTQDISLYFSECFEFIDKHLEDKNILIHCRQGKSRSSSITIAYLMYRFRVPVSTALTFAKQKRDRVCPNSGFLKSLKDFQSKIMNK